MNGIKSNLIFTIIFVILVCLPFPMYTMMKNYLDTTNYLNKELNELLVLNVDNYKEYPQLFETYYNEHLPFKNELVQMNSYMYYGLFGESSSDDVIIGKDGWLFYNNKESGDPMAEHYGTNLYSQEELNTIVTNLQISEKNLAERNIEFVLFVIPNKEKVYYDKLPDAYGEPVEYTRTDQLIEYIEQETSIRIVYPYKEMMEFKELNPDINVYSKLDTHWSNVGAYIGNKALLEELDIEVPEIEIKEAQQYIDTQRDLANMINLGKYIDTGIDYNIENSKPDEIVIATQGEGMVESNYGGDADCRNIFLVCDSFGIKMRPLIGSEFENVLFVQYEAFSTGMIGANRSNVVIIETAERFLDRLKKPYYVIGSF